MLINVMKLKAYSHQEGENYDKLKMYDEIVRKYA